LQSKHRFNTSDFNQTVTTLNKDVTLTANNTLEVQLQSDPGSALTIEIDGQAADSDGDGVIDSLDKCPNTLKGEAVDANGCSQSQLDDYGDGDRYRRQYGIGDGYGQHRTTIEPFMV
jgi:hypothetical protein